MVKEKEWPVYLSADDILHIRLVHEGRDVKEFCVSYELIAMGVSYQPCRIDNTHSEVHIDVLNARGEKISSETFGHVEPKDMVPTALEWMKERVKFHRARLLKELATAR